MPRLLLSVVYKPGQEFQFGNLVDYVKLSARAGKPEIEWSSPDDCTTDLSRLAERLRAQAPRIARLEYCLSPDVVASPAVSAFDLPGVEMIDLALDTPGAG